MRRLAHREIVVATIALVAACQPAPPPPSAAPVLPALSDAKAGEREVLTIDGVIANSVVAVPDEGGVTIFVGTIINGVESMVTTHSADGVKFGPTHTVTFTGGLHFVEDVMLDNGVWRAIHSDASESALDVATSTDGVHFGDDVPLDITSASPQPVPRSSRLLHLSDGYHLYFTSDRSTPCSDTGCGKSAISHATSANASGPFANASDVLADPPRSNNCDGCFLDTWQLVDVVRAGAPKCASKQPVLTALRPQPPQPNATQFVFDFDAVPLGADDATPTTTQVLPSVNDVEAQGVSVIATEKTLAVYTTHFDGNSPVRGHVRVTVIDAPEDARLSCPAATP